MFGRLVKYDFRSMFKQFGFIWPAALLLALVNHFTLSGLNSTSTVGETTAGMAMLVYVAILMAMFIITMIFVIQRFFKGLLGDEGCMDVPVGEQVPQAPEQGSQLRDPLDGRDKQDGEDRHNDAQQGGRPPPAWPCWCMWPFSWPCSSSP